MSIGKTALVCALSVLSGSAIAVSAQDAPSSGSSGSGRTTYSITTEAEHQEKLNLIKKYLVTTRAVRNSEVGFNLVLDNFARGMKAGLINRIDSNPKMTAEQRNEAKRKALVYMNSHVQRLKQLTMQKLDLPNLVVNTFTPLYDKYFTQSELESLVSFYESPAGKKSLDLMPKLAEEGAKNMNTSIFPIMKEISAQMEAEDKEGTIGSPSANQLNK